MKLIHTDEAVLLTFDIRELHLLRWIPYIRLMFSCLAFGSGKSAEGKEDANLSEWPSWQLGG